LVAGDQILPDCRFQFACAATNAVANLPLRKGANQRPIKLIHRLNACHVQFNVVDTKTLLDAQRNPEQYRDLVVRVAGYSALFVTLEKATHDDTSSLTIHDFCIPVRLDATHPR
jgi:hypothetical protein